MLTKYNWMELDHKSCLSRSLCRFGMCVICLFFVRLFLLSRSFRSLREMVSRWRCVSHVLCDSVCRWANLNTLLPEFLCFSTRGFSSYHTHICTDIDTRSYTQTHSHLCTHTYVYTPTHTYSHAKALKHTHHGGKTLLTVSTYNSVPKFPIPTLYPIHNAYFSVLP